jgi:hypothetical protein
MFFGERWEDGESSAAMTLGSGSGFLGGGH